MLSRFHTGLNPIWRAPFDVKVERDAYPNDNSVTTTIKFTALWRSFTVSYHRPLEAMD